MTLYNVVNADVTDWAADYDGPPFHALLCDAPYEMAFMNKGWDDSGVSFNPDTWRALAQHLYPGAFLFVFAGTINDDLISVAMRKAGLRKFHKCLNWSYGSGFPKATRIDTQVDKAAGAEREVVGRKAVTCGTGKEFGKAVGTGHKATTIDITAPATPLAQQWAGHRYGLQAIKPAVETILVFQKPYEGKPVDSITETGAGALNIDASRIGTDDNLNGGAYSGNTEKLVKELYGDWNKLQPDDYKQPQGRWPANLTLTHHPECVQVGTRRVRGITGGKRPHKKQAPIGTFQEKELRPYFNHADPDGLETIPAWDCHELCAVRALGEQSGELTSGERKGGDDFKLGRFENQKGHWGLKKGGGCKASKGTAARFFYNADWTYEQLEQSDPVYCQICLQEIPKHSIMSETQLGGSLCDSANGAKNSSAQGDQNSDSVETPVVQAQPPKNGGKSDLSSLPVSNAEKSGETTQATTANTVLESAPAREAEQLAHCVKSAASLCDLCATAIAQSLVQMQQGRALELTPSQDCTDECSRNILIQNLVRAVASLESTAITQIMQSQKLLNGFVSSAIERLTGETSGTAPTSSIWTEVQNQIDTATPVRYHAKASRRERDAGLEGAKHKRRVAYGHYKVRECKVCGSRRNDGKPHKTNPSCGHDNWEWAEMTTAGSKGGPARNGHPTVKPIALTKWLATLLLPPDAYAPRRLLCPFAGSGSEMIGAHLAGWEHIVGVELVAEYAEIAEARLAWWETAAGGSMFNDVKQILKSARG